MFYCLYFLISHPETGTEEELNGPNLDQSLKSKHPFEILNVNSFFMLPKTFDKCLERDSIIMLIDPKFLQKNLVLNLIYMDRKGFALGRISGNPVPFPEILNSAQVALEDGVHLRTPNEQFQQHPRN